jgi:uncharacterized lipoprotein YmbA
MKHLRWSLLILAIGVAGCATGSADESHRAFYQLKAGAPR